MNDPDSTPLCCVEAEEAVLSAIILDPARVTEVTRIVDSRHWYADTNRWVWTAVLRLWSREDASVDAVSVANELRAMGRLDQIGGTPTLFRIVDATPAVAHVAYHAQIVRDMYLARETAAALESAAHDIRARTETHKEALANLRDRLRVAREML